MRTEPCLGLVLCGTGVPGLAQAGALAALERAGLTPDVVVGVSTAALVAGAYAAREDWSSALLSIDRSHLPALSAAGEDETFARLRAALRNARQLAPSVWTWGRQGYEGIARTAVAELVGQRRTFDDLRVPAALVATDLNATERVVLRDGSALDAILASLALPGLAPPYRWDGRALVDGAFTDPAPVDVARDLGADRVLAIAPAPTHHPREDELAAGPISRLLRGLEIGQRAFLEERLADADAVLLSGREAHVRLLDFSELDGAARRAGAAAVDALPTLRQRLALPAPGDPEMSAGADP